MKKSSLTVNIIGAGRLGAQLALSLQPLVTLQALFSRTLKRAQIIASDRGIPLVPHQLSQLPPADLTLLTVQDDALPTLAKALSQHPQLHPDQCYVHFSGALPSQVLSPLRDKGCVVACCHPFRLFTTTPFPEAFEQCYCFTEGGERALMLLTPLLESCGAVFCPVLPAHKLHIHLAAVFSSNFLNLLASTANKLLSPLELPQHTTQMLILNMMQQTLARLTPETPFMASLTGPLCRGDQKTIHTHLDLLATHPPLYRLYQAFADLALQDLPLDDTLKNQLHSLFLLPPALIK